MRKLALTCTVAALTALSANADMVFSNDFNANFTGITDANGTLSLAAADSDFDSKYLKISSKTDGNFAFPFYDSDNAIASSVATFTFDARFGTADFHGIVTETGDTMFRLRIRDTTGGQDTVRFDLTRDLVPADQVSTYSYVINNSSAAVSIENGTGNIAASSWIMFENGVELSHGTMHANAITDNAVDYLTFWINGDKTAGKQSVVSIDNFKVYDNAFVAIPEPATFGLFGFGAAAAFILRRKKNS